MFHSLPFQQVQTRLTLFSKSFAYFPHGPCLLSVSHTYVAADEIYRQFCAPLPRNVTQWEVPCATTCTWHTRLAPSSIFLFFFQKACMRGVAGHSSSKNNSRLMAPIPMLSLSMCIRHYLWNPMWALILHLLIWLKSVGVLTWYHISSLALFWKKKAGACRAAVYATRTDVIPQC